MTELTGQVLGGRYRVEAFIGQGGMADVYKVRDIQRAVFLAMKILHADLAEDQVFIRNFEHEAQTLERLQHPNIVRFYGFEKSQNIAFILMDFIDGLTLRREIFLYKNGLRPGRVMEIMQPVCAALYYAHQQGMIHCDIKPANIITHRNGTIYLTDFGIARRSESGTQPLTGVGSPAYMAPEQFEGKEPTLAVDIYSLGVVMYEMLTGGQRPFTGESGNASGSTTKRIVWEKKHLQPPSPRVYNPEITPELEAVVMMCLQHSPRRRFRSTLDLLQALEVAVRGLQPEDDDQTRVDLPKPGKAAQPALSVPAGQPSGPLQPPEKTASKGEKTSSAASQSPPTANHTRAAAERLASDAGKAQAPNLDPISPAGKAATAVVKSSALPGKPAGGAELPPAQVKQSAVDHPAVETVSVAKSAEKSQRAARQSLPEGKQAAAEVKKAGQAVKEPAWRRFLNHWLMIGAAGLALALISMAIFSARMKPPVSLPATEPPKTAVVSAAARARTATLISAQANTALPTPVEATPTAEPAATIPPAPMPTPMGGSERVAFASDRSGSVQVWIMDVDNPENRQQVTNAKAGACQPAWSPDGAQIAFTTPCKGPSIYYAGATIKIIQLADARVTELPVKAPGIGGAFDPAWSPDGETLLFTAVLGEKTEIRAINLQDLQVRTLANQGTKNAQPAWSRDGNYISYIFSNDQNWEALWYMQPNGESKEVMAHSARFSEPAWAPDGLHILASINKGDNIPVLALIDRSNPMNGAQPLISGAYRMSHASISPDGNWAVFWTEKGGGKPEILLSSLDGKETRLLTNNTLRDFHPAWSPK